MSQNQQRRLKYQSPLLVLSFQIFQIIAVGVPAGGKCGAVEPGRVVEVVAVSYAIEVGGTQALGGRGGLVAGVVFGGLLVDTGMVGGAVEAEGHLIMNYHMEYRALRHLTFDSYNLLNAMKHIMLCWFALAFINTETHSQNIASSASRNLSYSLTITSYGNDKPKAFRYRQNVHIRLDGKTLIPKDSAGLLLFNQLTAKDTFDLMVKSRGHIFIMDKIPGWRLQNGAHVSIGVLKNFKKLQSIAEQDDVKTEDEGYETWSKRYRIAPEGSTLDLEDAKSILTVHYLVLLPITYGCGSVLTSYQIKRKRL